jgi:F420H(2)-dependent biliverdin reductase
MGLDPHDLSEEALQFLVDRHLATLTTVRADGSPHVVPVGFTFDPTTGIARVICSSGTQKTRNIQAGSRAVVCQVDGGRWLSLEGEASVVTDPERVLDAARRYAVRYQEPRPNPNRVAIEINVDRILGRA